MANDICSHKWSLTYNKNLQKTYKIYFYYIFLTLELFPKCVILFSKTILQWTNQNKEVKTITNQNSIQQFQNLQEPIKINEVKLEKGDLSKTEVCGGKNNNNKKKHNLIYLKTFYVNFSWLSKVCFTVIE